MAQTTNPPLDPMQSRHAHSSLDGSARRESNSPSRFSRLGYQESIEKARRAKAVNNISLHEEKRHRLRAEAARRASIQKQQLEDQRCREEEANWTGREYGAKLLESLEMQTKARLEAEFREEIRIRVYSDEQLFSAYQKMRKDEITLQLEEELEPIVKSKLEIAKMKEVFDLLREELRPGVVQSLKEELEETTREDIRNNLRLQLEGDVLKQLRLENVETVMADLRRELRDEALQERELMLSTTTCRETLNASPPISLAEAAIASLHPTENPHKLGENTIPDYSAKTSVKPIESIKEAVTMLESEDGPDRGQTVTTGPLQGKHGIDEGVGLSGELSEPDLPPQDISSTGYHAAQSASKDFTFDPSLHEIRFSDPVDSPASARKRSSSASEHSNAEAGHATKRARTESVVSDSIAAFQDAQLQNHFNHSTTYEVESGSNQNNHGVSEDMDITASGRTSLLDDPAPKDPDVPVREALNVGELERGDGKRMNEGEEESEAEFEVNEEEDVENEGEDEEEEESDEEGEEEDEDGEEKEVEYMEAEDEDDQNERRVQSYRERDRGELMEGSDAQSPIDEDEDGDEDEDAEEDEDEDEEIFLTNGGFANAELNGDALNYTPTSSQQGLDYNTDTQTDDFESSSEAYDEYDAQHHGPPKPRFVDSLIAQGNTQETAIDLSDSDDEGENRTLVEDVNSRASIRADKIS